MAARQFKPMPTAAVVRELLDYDPMSGEFRWKARCISKRDNLRWNASYAGKTAGRHNNNGYIEIKVYGQFYGAHRLAWLYSHGCEPHAFIDHRDLDRSNNALANLRAASKSQNNANSPKPRNNTSGFKGVTFHRGNRRWQAQITSDGKKIYLGSFATKQLAHDAYVAAAVTAFGEFARAT